MTIKEAIEVLTANIMIACDRAQFSSSCKEMVENALDMAIAALEKQEAKKPIPCDLNSTWVKCPTCGDTYIDEYCGQCGQKIDWTKGE